MKNLALALTTLILSASTVTSAFAASGENGFSCESRWYRDAKLSVSPYSLELHDSYVPGRQVLEEIVETSLGLQKGKVMVNTIGLSVVPEGDLRCEASGLLVNCQGSAKRAYVVVTGWLLADGAGGDISLSLPVELKDLRLKTSLGSKGPISIGSGPTKINLTRLSLDVTAKVVIQGRELNLAWEAFFNSRDDRNSGSSCRKK